MNSSPRPPIERIRGKVVRDFLPLARLTSLNTLRRTQQALEDIVAERDRLIAESQRVLNERQQAIETYQAILAEREHERQQAIETYQAILAEREQEIRTYQKIVSDNEQSVSTYQALVAERERSILSYQALVTELQGRSALPEDLESLKQQLAGDAETIAELAALQRRSLAKVERQLGALAELTPDLAARSYVNRPLEELGEGGAELLNYASTHLGFAAQGGVWFNWPIFPGYRPGAAFIGGVNERIIELPYVLAALANLPSGSHLLDFGATESPLALSLASLGHDVIALDQRPYPLEHRHLTVVVGPVEDWAGPPRPFDAIISLSTLEHVGIRTDHYGSTVTNLGLDREILERFRGWLAPRGRLIMTAPYGRWAIDSLQRTYDAGHLEELLQGWQVEERRFAFTSDSLQWSVVDEEPDPGLWDSDTHGVVMLQAVPAA